MCLVGSIESSLEIDFFGYDGCRSSLFFCLLLGIFSLSFSFSGGECRKLGPLEGSKANWKDWRATFWSVKKEMVRRREGRNTVAINKGNTWCRRRRRKPMGKNVCIRKHFYHRKAIESQHAQKRRRAIRTRLFQRLIDWSRLTARGGHTTDWVAAMHSKWESTKTTRLFIFSPPPFFLNVHFRVVSKKKKKKGFKNSM